MKKISIVKIIISFLGFVLLLQCCKLDKDFCRLSSFDKEFTLEEYESLEYLENGTTKIKIKIESKQNDSWNKNGGWFYTGDGGYESIFSGFFLPDSSRWIKILSSGCISNAHVNIGLDRSLNPISRFDIVKDSLTGIVRTIQNIEYENCFVFSDTIDIKELIYVKDYGVVKLELLNGYSIELIRKIK